MNMPRTQIHTGLLGLCIALALQACASTTPYQSAQRSGGYSEQKLEDNRFRVQFSGNSRTDKATVENYLLYRCAELTLDHGYDYFVSLNSNTDSESVETQTFSFGTGFGRWYWHPFGAVSVSTQQSSTEYMAEAQIVMFRGEKPADNLQAFDARQIANNLGPSIVRPEETAPVQ